MLLFIIHAKPTAMGQDYAIECKGDIEITYVYDIIIQMDSPLGDEACNQCDKHYS